jgi:hypothetical protein
MRVGLDTPSCRPIAARLTPWQRSRRKSCRTDAACIRIFSILVFSVQFGLAPVSAPSGKDITSS